MQPKLETTSILAMGIAAQLPGIKISIMELQAKYDSLQAQLAQLQGVQPTDTARSYIAKRMGRPPGSKNKAPSKLPGMRASGWPEDREERKREMARRKAVSKGKAPSKRSVHLTSTGKINKNGLPQKMHPRDPNHPQHDAWIKKLKKSQKRAWNNMTPEQQEARIAKMRRAA